MGNQLQSYQLFRRLIDRPPCPPARHAGGTCLRFRTDFAAVFNINDLAHYGCPISALLTEIGVAVPRMTKKRFTAESQRTRRAAEKRSQNTGARRHKEWTRHPRASRESSLSPENGRLESLPHGHTRPLRAGRELRMRRTSPFRSFGMILSTPRPCGDPFPAPAHLDARRSPWYTRLRPHETFPRGVPGCPLIPLTIRCRTDIG
jgi:hypothetical protein